jgi:hypothetical protein
MSFGKFTMRLAAFSAVIALVIKLVQTFYGLLPDAVWGAYVFFILLTLLIYKLTEMSLKMSVKNSMSITLGAMFFRLFSSFIYLVIYMIINEQRDIPFVAAFMILYLLFTVFEIYHIVANLRPDSKNSK